MGFFNRKHDLPVELKWQVFVQPDFVEREVYDHKGIEVTIYEPGFSWTVRTEPFSIWEIGRASSEESALSAALAYVEAARG